MGKVGPPITSPWLFSWGKLHPQPHLCFIQAAASSKQLRVAAISSLVHSIPSKEPGMQQKSSAWYTPSYNLVLRPEKTHQNMYKSGYKNIVPVSLSASRGVSFVGPERKTKIGNQTHKKETAAFGVQSMLRNRTGQPSNHNV